MFKINGWDNVDIHIMDSKGNLIEVDITHNVTCINGMIRDDFIKLDEPIIINNIMFYNGVAYSKHPSVLK